jgi:hypothetical protein
MLKQKATLVALAAVLTSASLVGAQSSTSPHAGEVPQPQIIAMINLVANVDKSIDTKKAKAGDPFSAKVATGGKLNDGTNVPVGSLLEGHVDSVTPSQNKGDSVLTVTVDKLAIKNGNEIPIKATIIRIDSVAPITEDKGYGDPSAYRVQNIPSSRPASLQDPNAPPSPHSIPGLTLASSPHDAASGTFTQAKGNLHLGNTVQLQVSVGVVPPGGVVK